MEKILGVTQPNIPYHINNSLNKKKITKPMLHQLTENNIENRKKRSWNLYRKLNKTKFKKFKTTYVG